MHDRLDDVSDEQAARWLAVRFCREVYLLDESTDCWWHALQPLAYRLDADLEDTMAALNYAAHKGWLDLIGTPIAYAKLLEPGHRLFADADVALPRRAAKVSAQ